MDVLRYGLIDALYTIYLKSANSLFINMKVDIHMCYQPNESNGYAVYEHIVNSTYLINTETGRTSHTCIYVISRQGPQVLQTATENIYFSTMG